MKVIIAGGRNFNDYGKLFQFCNNILFKQTEVEIVSGTANGADKLGEKYANDKRLPIKKFPPNWKMFGRGAGIKRNVEMANYADVLIAFWDSKSKGTKHMIDQAKHNNLEVMISYY